MSMANKPPTNCSPFPLHPGINRAAVSGDTHWADATPLKPFFMSAEKVTSSPLETADWEQLSKKTADNISDCEGQLNTRLPWVAKNIVIEVMVLPVAFWKLSSTQKADWKGHGFASEFAMAVAVTVGLGFERVITVASVPFWGMGLGSWAQAEAEKTATASSKRAGRKCFKRTPRLHTSDFWADSGANVVPKSFVSVRFNSFVMLG
jgi:hypothetical protein